MGGSSAAPVQTQQSYSGNTGYSFAPYAAPQSNPYQPSYGQYAQPYAQQQSYGSPYGMQQSYGFQPYGNAYARQPSSSTQTYGNFNGYGQEGMQNGYGQQFQGYSQQQPYQPFNMAWGNNSNTQSPNQVTTPYAPQGTFGGPASYGMGPSNAGFGFGNGATRVPDTDMQTAGQFNPQAMQGNTQPTSGQQNWNPQGGWGHHNDWWQQPQMAQSGTTPGTGLGAIVTPETASDPNAASSTTGPTTQTSTTGSA